MLEDILRILSHLPRLQLITVSILPVLFAITVHEAAHGWIAKFLGDPTAERLGRVTLNPLKHIDPVGTILVPAVLLLVKAPFLFGWARPVPVTWENLRHPKRDMVLVAAAGPGANLGMALFWGMAAKIGTLLPDAWAAMAAPIIYMGLIGILINVLLLVFNLLPVPPLDGSGVITLFMSEQTAFKFTNFLSQPMYSFLGIVIAWRILPHIFGPIWIIVLTLLYGGV